MCVCSVLSLSCLLSCPVCLLCLTIENWELYIYIYVISCLLLIHNCDNIFMIFVVMNYDVMFVVFGKMQRVRVECNLQIVLSEKNGKMIGVYVFSLGCTWWNELEFIYVMSNTYVNTLYIFFFCSNSFNMGCDMLECLFVILNFSVREISRVAKYVSHWSIPIICQREILNFILLLYIHTDANYFFMVYHGERLIYDMGSTIQIIGNAIFGILIFSPTRPWNRLI